MYSKYRIYLQTTRGGYAMAASNTVNDLVALVADWLENTSQGRSVTDYYDKNGKFEGSDAREVMLYELDPKTGAYVFSERLPVESRRDIISKIRELGAR